MAHEQLPLPYSLDALEPLMSKETLEYHYGKHHKGYVDKLNQLIQGTEFENLSIEQTMLKSSGKIFNNAAQVWNHDFFWRSMTPDQKQLKASELKTEMDSAYGSQDEFLKKFIEKGVDHFGSGYVWLVVNQTGALDIVTTANAENPKTEGSHPLLTCDLWEHAYYIDYRNARLKFLEAFKQMINWQYVVENYSSYLGESARQKRA